MRRRRTVDARSVPGEFISGLLVFLAELVVFLEERRVAGTAHSGEVLVQDSAVCVYGRLTSLGHDAVPVLVYAGRVRLVLPAVVRRQCGRRARAASVHGAVERGVAGQLTGVVTAEVTDVVKDRLDVQLTAPSLTLSFYHHDDDDDEHETDSQRHHQASDYLG